MPKRKCKNGLLKTPVKTANGMRYCKKSVRKRVVICRLLKMKKYLSVKKL